MAKFRKRNGKRFKRNGNGNYIRRQVGKNKAELKVLMKGVERKFHDRQNNVVVMTNQAVWASINDGIDQGFDQGDRVGNKINGKKIFIRGFFTNKGANAADCVCRIIIVRIPVPRITAPAVTRLLNDADNVNSFRLVTRDNEMIIMYDQTFAMDTTQMSLIPFKWSKKINTISEWTGATGSSTTITANTYGIYAFSTITDNPGTLDSPDFNFGVRYTYTDS